MDLKRGIVSAAVLACCAGTVMGQATDGRFTDSIERGLYGAAKWVNTTATGFGNASPSNPCDDNGVGGNPAAVTTGVEYKIPRVALGSPTGNIRVLAFINGQGHDYASNQFLPSLPAGTGNLGGDGAGNFTGNVGGVNLANFAGDQFFSTSIAGLATATPTVDGTLDASYGPAKALQLNRTRFGNSTTGTQAAGGSELNGLYMAQDADHIYIFLSGNTQSNFNKLELLIDTDTATNGQNPMASESPNVDFGALGKLVGLTFDAGFAPDFYITFGAGNNPVEYYPNFAVIDTDDGGYMGNNQAGNGEGTLEGGNNRNIEISLNNINTGGVDAPCPPPSGNADVSNGSELNALYSYILNGKLHVLITGNLENGGGTACDAGGNKLNLFFDADGAENGQNVLASGSLEVVDISYGNLARMGGMTFDSGFAADYWMSIKTGGSPVHQVMDSAVLRTDGKRSNALGNPLDYGAYDGGNKADYNPVTFRGNFIPCNGNPFDPMPQDGFTANLYTNYSPRAAAESLALDNSNPVGTPGLLSFSIDNSNFGGVGGSGGSVDDAVNVNTGFEVVVDLVELGWDGESCIKIAGFITSGDATYGSNQVIGGLPAQDYPNLGNQGNMSTIDFNSIDGQQWVGVSGECGTACEPCAADYNVDGGVDGADVEAFFTDWAAAAGCSDVNVDGGVDGSDVEAFFLVWSAGGC
jgi:hypothetical protein